ncbi:MAG: hypothetical protein AB7P76_12040 [Candidatus Melainabacteria bacterium]
MNPILATQPETERQTAIAMDCLARALGKLERGETQGETHMDDSQGHPVLPYLIHAAVLFFVCRDLRLFAAISWQPVFETLGLGTKIQKLPTHNQIRALIQSKATEPLWAENAIEAQKLLETAASFSDRALGVEALHAFRDQVVQLGVPSVSVTALCGEALRGWETLNRLSGAIHSGKPLTGTFSPVC